MAESLLTDLDDSPASIPSGTVTFLFTDIQGSTQLLERLREQYALVLAEQRDVLRAIFAEWNGHEIDTQGDALNKPVNYTLAISFRRSPHCVSSPIYRYKGRLAL